jgi:hypothetical protein
MQTITSVPFHEVLFSRLLLELREQLHVHIKKLLCVLSHNAASFLKERNTLIKLPHLCCEILYNRMLELVLGI